MNLSTYSYCAVQVQSGDDVGSARALLRLADHAAPHQSVHTWCVISRQIAPRMQDRAVPRAPLCFTLTYLLGPRGTVPSCARA